MNSANAQVCLEVSFEKTFTTKRKKRNFSIANEILFFLFETCIVCTMQSQQYTMLYQRRVDFCGGKV